MTTHMASVSPARSSHHTEAARIVAASHVLSVTGILFVALAVFAPELLGKLYQLAASGDTGTTMDSAARLGAALFGSLTLGWGVTLQRLGRGETLSRATITGAIVWFATDSACSIGLGYGWNALSNAGFLLVIVLLLRAPRSG